MGGEGEGRGTRCSIATVRLTSRLLCRFLPRQTHNSYVTAERMAKAPNLKAAITAGIGSDHVDLEAAIANKVDVSEVTFCNSISVSEHVGKLRP